VNYAIIKQARRVLSLPARFIAPKVQGNNSISPMPSIAAKTSALPVTVIPDCCNTGVIFRVLLAVNVAVASAVLMRAGGLRAGLLDFMESSILVELSSLSSLIALCGLRGVVRSAAPWAQRAACALLPAVITGVIIRFLSSLDLFAAMPAGPMMVKGMAIAALFGILLQHYFELRARAFSPVLAEARLQALQARIRPHFLFNSLNAVLSLIRTEPRQAENTLEDLADLFRVLLRDARAMTSLEQEIRLCKQYLSIEKIRLGDRLQVQWKAAGITDRFLRKARVPALLLQPLLENAVHYGVEPATQPALVRIHLSRSIDRIDISVVNPYHDNAVSAGNHMALDNIRERLALLYDVEAQLTTRIARGFFEVRLRFPYVKGE
jgi:two-component system, LytTR family, sensor histidine kinase AlgZ